MIDRGHDLPITRQAKALNYQPGQRLLPAPSGVHRADLAIMRRLDELHLDYPFAGSRMLRDLLAHRGLAERPAARRHADEADGHRGALSQAQHLEARAGS